MPAGPERSRARAALELPVTWAARTEQPGGKTSPEELIAAAHASCFSMALALMLCENLTPPERLRVAAACTLDEVDGAPRITSLELTVRAPVPRLAKAGLRRSVAQAANLCPASNALRGNVAITVRTSSTAADRAGQFKQAGHNVWPKYQKTSSWSLASSPPYGVLVDHHGSQVTCRRRRSRAHHGRAR